MIVVDASVLTDYLLGRPTSTDVMEQVMSGQEHDSLHAPELIEPETLNALRGLARGGKVTERRAGEAIRDLAHLRLLRYRHEPLRDRVWALRDALSAYDATYLALAEALGAAALLTGDRGLALVAARSLGRDRVHHVA